MVVGDTTDTILFEVRRKREAESACDTNEASV